MYTVSILIKILKVRWCNRGHMYNNYTIFIRQIRPQDFAKNLCNIRLSFTSCKLRSSIKTNVLLSRFAWIIFHCVLPAAPCHSNRTHVALVDYELNSSAQFKYSAFQMFGILFAIWSIAGNGIRSEFGVSVIRRKLLKFFVSNLFCYPVSRVYVPAENARDNEAWCHDYWIIRKSNNVATCCQVGTQ